MGEAHRMIANDVTCHKALWSLRISHTSGQMRKICTCVHLFICTFEFKQCSIMNSTMKLWIEGVASLERERERENIVVMMDSEKWIDEQDIKAESHMR